MRVGFHDTGKHVWEVFKTNGCTNEYLADGDGTVIVHEVEVNCYMVTSSYGERKLLQDFAPTSERAHKIVDSVRNDEPAADVTPVLKGAIYTLDQGYLVALNRDLEVAFREAELYASATYPGMLERSRQNGGKG